MNPGKLNKRVTLRIPVNQTVDGLDKTVYIDGAKTWAAIQPLRGREFWQAQATQTENLFKIKMRYLPGIKDDWQLWCEGISYSITNIVDVDMRHRELEIYCKVVS